MFSLRSFHFDLAGSCNACGASTTVDLVLLEEKRDAFDICLHALVLEPHHGGEIEFRPTKLDAHPVERVGSLLIKLGGAQQRFRRNAADVKTRAAEGLILLHYRHFHAELRRTNGAHIASGTGADDNQIIGHASPTMGRSQRRSYLMIPKKCSCDRGVAPTPARCQRADERRCEQT